MVAAFSLLTLFSLTISVASHAGDAPANTNGMCQRGLQAWSEVEEELIEDPRSLLRPSAAVEKRLREISEKHDLPLSMLRVGPLTIRRYNGN